MKKYLVFICILLLTLIFNSGCKKSLTVETGKELTATEASVKPLAQSYCYSCGIVDNMPVTDHSGDTTDLPTILGMQHVNPYLVPNMQRAYANLGYTGVSVTANNLYVRFLPSSATQLGVLDSVMNAQSLDLFDAPMDYDVTQEGDYYQDPTIPIEQVTYQYAVVPMNFQFPAGISYSILAQIHIPSDTYQSVESEAERLASIQDSLNAFGALALTPRPETTDCGTNCHYDFTIHACSCCPSGYTWNGTACVVPTCPSGYYWNGSSCVLSGPPPPPPADAAIPAGLITVSDVNLGTMPGLRIARVVAKRWFKIQRLYTDDAGHFTCTKKFKHKVKIVIKFLNDYANVKGVRGARLWQMYLPISKVIGVYSGDKSNISYNFARNTAGANITKNIGNRLWAGATVHNSVLEHKDYASQFGFSPAPMGLSIMLTNWGITSGTSACPLFKIRGGAMNNNFVTIFVGNGGALSPLNLPNMDIIMDYHIDNPSSGYTPFSSNFIKETIYHELSHASQYVFSGKNWYLSFFNAEVDEMGHWMLTPSKRPYGDGSSANSPIIALGEAWGYHMGHFLADQRYNVQNNNKGDQLTLSQDGGYTGTEGVALESFNPNLAADNFRWIPKGLMLDLMDNNSPPNPPELPFSGVNDNVSGYTIGQISGALQSDVSRISDFKSRLISLYGTTQLSQINTLFASYNY